MQKIFYNGKIIGKDKNEKYSAMMTNDGSVVFAGNDEDVLNLKTEETKLVNLENNFVYPAIFDLKTNMFQKIDDKIKNAKKGRNFQISSDINEDYDNFANYEDYKKEFLLLQEELLGKGVGTIVELNLDRKGFAFWKKISEDKLLKLDVVCYVDILDSKQVMDDNCVTYRKYKNRFRLGGYYLKMDGQIHDLKAWLTSRYFGTKNHYGMGLCNGENLYYLLKTALEERKQVIFDVNGDKAMREVLTVFEEVEAKEKIDNFYRPVFLTSGFIPRKLYSKIKHFDISIIINLLNNNEDKQTKRFLGIFRKRYFFNLKDLIKFKLNVSFACDDFSCSGFLFVQKLDKLLKQKFGLKMQKNNKYVSYFTIIMYNFIYFNPAYICFDDVTKGELENQKRADFFVTNEDLFSCNNLAFYNIGEED